MDLNTKFVLSRKGVQQEHLDFFDEYGFIHFKKFFNPEQIQKAIDSIDSIQREWLTQGMEKINGIPIRFGHDEHGDPIIQRFAFSSLYNEYLHEMLQDDRIDSLRKFLGPNSRVAENEKDGLVVNHFINTGESNYSKLGWHTDGLRDLLMNLKLNPMLNVGIYLDDSPLEKGGLRVLPGTHKNGLYDMMFRKKYFVDNNPDEEEVPIIAEAGDLTVHSGRIWHRVALATIEGAPSRRRVMYFPIIKGKYKPKSHRSPTPIYHKFNRLIK